jgi:ribosomal protein S18 acetylase RimI-like enzyme
MAVIEHNLHVFWDAYGRADVRPIGGDHALAFVSDSPFGMLNPVVRFRAEDTTADAAIGELLGAAARRSLDQWWWGGPGDPADLGRRLTAAGLTAHAPSPGMARGLAGWSAEPAPEGLEIAPVDGDLDAYFDVFLPTFDLPEEHWPAMRRAYAAMSGDPRVHNFLGRLDGQVVACSTLLLDDGGTAGVWNVATTAAVRGRGVGTAMTAAAMSAGAARGARDAILIASPLGEPVYQRMGFRTVAEMPMWSRLS